MGTEGRDGRRETGDGSAPLRGADSTAAPDSTSSLSYSNAELMACVAARELRDGEVVFVGIGLPNLACNLARATHAPRLTLIYESGAIGAQPERLPVSVGDPSLVTGSLMICGMADVFQLFLQNGRSSVGSSSTGAAAFRRAPARAGFSFSTRSPSLVKPGIPSPPRS